MWGSGGKPATPVTLTFATESGGSQGTALTDSPLNISAKIVRPDGSPEALLVSANVQLLDDSGKPAEYGGHVQDATALKPGSEQGTWIYNGSVPSSPGTYHARIEWQALPENDATPATFTQTLELAEPRLQVVKDSGSPLSSGYVFARDANLWIMSTDTTRQKRLTFYEPFYEYADNPAWSPDGKTLAFAYSPKVAANEIPATNIWTMNPDGTGAKEIVTHGQDESVYEPSWSPDGKSIFYSDEKDTEASTTYNAAGAPVGDLQIMKLDLGSGTGTQWAANAQSPSCCDAQGRLTFLENVPSQDPSGDLPPGQRLVIANTDGSGKKVLVDEKGFQMMYAPDISPDGKWVAFAAINVPPPKSETGFDFLRWLLFLPDKAYAHGLPWDMYMVSTSGGAPIQLTSLNEDQPYPVWLDNSTLAFMGVRGLYKLQIGPDGQPKGQADKIQEGAPHGGLTWHQP